MAALVVIETIALALLGVLVCGLLRSHAEILRALHGMGVEVGNTAGAAPQAREQRVAAPVARARPGATAVASEAVDLVGTTPAGEAVQVGVRSTGHDTLLAFLSSGCTACAEFWRSFRAPATQLGLPDGTRLVIVTKGAAEESVGRLRELAPAAVPVVMSSEAWKDYGVPVTPYFLHVDGPSGAVTGQGVGATWSQVASLLRQATADGREARDGRAGRRPRRDERPTVADVEAGVDRKLMAAGLYPGDPSLYPSRREGQQRG
jgi:hypothetical protein